MVDLTGYKLTFSDEFDARSISQTGANTTWADIRPEWRYDANSDIGYGHSSFVDPGSGYDPFSVSNGVLSITAQQDHTASGIPGSWESGLINTRASFAQTYGYFEMRADLADSLGAWDAFWLMPANVKDQIHSGAWQELDIVEHYGFDPASVYRWIHTTDPSSNPNEQLQVTSNNPEQLSGFHTYGMDWQPDKISFYFDGKLMGSRPTPTDMHSPMYIIANLAVQDSADQAGTPMTTKIDYIRAYSNDPNAPAVDLTHNTAPTSSTVQPVQQTDAAAHVDVSPALAAPVEPAPAPATTHDVAPLELAPVAQTASAPAIPSEAASPALPEAPVSQADFVSHAAPVTPEAPVVASVDVVPHAAPAALAAPAVAAFQDTPVADVASHAAPSAPAAPAVAEVHDTPVVDQAPAPVSASLASFTQPASFASESFGTQEAASSPSIEATHEASATAPIVQVAQHAEASTPVSAPAAFSGFVEPAAAPPILAPAPESFARVAISAPVASLAAPVEHVASHEVSRTFARSESAGSDHHADARSARGDAHESLRSDAFATGGHARSDAGALHDLAKSLSDPAQTHHVYSHGCCARMAVEQPSHVAEISGRESAGLARAASRSDANDVHVSDWLHDHGQDIGHGHAHVGHFDHWSV